VTIFDLLFLACALATLVAFITASAAAIRGRWSRSGSILKRWGIAAAAYLALALIVGAASPQRVLSVGDPWCFDDWCLSVEAVSRTPAASDIAYTVSLTIFSRARRVSQRAKGAWIYLIDSRGRRYEPVPEPDATPLDMLLRPGEAVNTSRQFRIPTDASGLGLITGHGGPYCSWPLIIGESGCVFNKPTMVRIE
jgi:hypothetical protein